MAAKFNVGQVLVTVGVHNDIYLRTVRTALEKHLQGDWGDMPPEDKELNDAALEAGEGRLMSKWADDYDTVFWIITEADRSATTVLLPEEY